MSISGVSSSTQASSDTSGGNTVQQLESQERSVQRQISTLEKNSKLDADTKEAQLTQLEAQLEQIQQALEQAETAQQTASAQKQQAAADKSAAAAKGSDPSKSSSAPFDDATVSIHV